MQKEEIKYLVFDVESVPDGRLIKTVKYPGEDISEDEAIAKFQDEILKLTDGRSNFIPVTFQYPVCVVIAKVDENFAVREIVSLDEGNFSAEEMSRKFWFGVEVLYKKASLVSFNGRGFDVPILELMAYRYGHEASRHLTDKFGTRFRFGNRHLDLQEFMSNNHAIKMTGGLNMLAKVLGLPGKMDTAGDQVYDLFKEGKMETINNYCFHDVLDTYLIFLRTRVMLGKISLEQEQKIREQLFEYCKSDESHAEAYKVYMDHLKDHTPWP